MGLMMFCCCGSLFLSSIGDAAAKRKAATTSKTDSVIPASERVPTQAAPVVESDRLTSDFLPCIAGNVQTFDEERCDFDLPHKIVRSTNRITFQGNNQMQVEWSIENPKPNSSIPSSGKGSAKLEVRNGLTDWLGWITIKVGAKPGDEWKSPRGNITFKLVGFETVEAVGRGDKPILLKQAIIESTFVNKGGEGSEHLTRYVLEKGSGVQSVKEYMTRNGKTVMIKHRQLISSTN